MAHSFDIGPSISINNQISLENREQKRDRLESWILEILTDKESEVLREIANELRASGYTEEHGCHDTALHFHLESISELQFNNSASNNFDQALHEESWMTEEEIEELESRLEQACRRTVSAYDPSVIE